MTGKNTEGTAEENEEGSEEEAVLVEYIWYGNSACTEANDY